MSWDAAEHIHVRIKPRSFKDDLGCLWVSSASLGLKPSSASNTQSRNTLTVHQYRHPQIRLKHPPRSTGTDSRSYRCRYFTRQPTDHDSKQTCMSMFANGREQNVPFDEFLAGPHFLEQGWVADDSCCVLDLAARLIQTRNHPHDGAFHDIRQVCNAVERHAAGPLVDHLNHAEARLGYEVVGIVGGKDDLVFGLNFVDLLGNLHDLGYATFE
jgi:hypothetical protein